MRFIRLVLIACVVVGIGVVAYFWMNREKSYPDGAREEARLQQAELRECRARLAQFYQAWSAYRKDHKGAEPPSIEALFPKYLSRGELLLCPTAARWMKNRVRMEQGVAVIDKKEYPVTYGFMWLTSGYAHSIRKDADAAPLVRCEAHQEGMYRAAYKKRPPLGAYSPPQYERLIPEAQVARVQVVRRNGQVSELDPVTGE